MPLKVRRLGPGDEAILAVLSREDDDFDVPGRSAPMTPLSDEAAHAFLSDPNVLHFVAEDSETGAILGHTYCQFVRKRDGDAPSEVLLYEIGVRSAHRRKKVGRALMDAVHAFMAEQKIRELWVLADNPGAVAFYKSCGFQIARPAPVYMVYPPEPQDADEDEGGPTLPYPKVAAL